MNAGVTEKAVLYSHFCFSWELSEIGAAKPDGARLLREAQPPSGGCVLKRPRQSKQAYQVSAAFGRLCVETGLRNQNMQPHFRQPPSGGCVLKPAAPVLFCRSIWQPPSGGCVLKLDDFFDAHFVGGAAAFGRLCVETKFYMNIDEHLTTAAFGRLCVETK